MQMKISKSVAGIFAGTFLPIIASAHPGHAPSDVAAEVLQPLAGADHFVAFVALTSILLIAFRFVLKAINAKRRSARK
jgi:hydrogenase/urease accessory protein HupE